MNLDSFHKLSRRERLQAVQKLANLTDKEVQALSGERSLTLDVAEHLIENVVGCFPIPLGIAAHFNIDGKDVLIPMAVEETSIIAAASASAKWIKREGSIKTYMKGRLIIGQIQIPYVRNAVYSKQVLNENRQHLISIANEVIPGLVTRGGGVRDIAIRELDRFSLDGKTIEGKMLVLHVLCDPCDAMGANLINQICETLKPHVEHLTDERVGLCILSNLVDSKLAVSEVIIRNIEPILGRGIEEASRFAETDPYRAATHNKGVLNGIDPILIATGNDWRAVEAGIHAYASRSGKYQPVTRWRVIDGDLVGRFEAPIAVGTVGGVTRVHPAAQAALKVMGVKKAEELARVCAAVGLVQNLGALKALSTVGIVKGHMQLHAANLAIAAGADIHEIGPVRAELAHRLEGQKKINLSDAKEILEALRGSTHAHFH